MCYNYSMWNKFFGLFRFMNRNVNPGEIAHAFSCGLLLGFLPKDNLLWYLILIFILFLRINKLLFIASVLLFTLLAGLADPLFDMIGYNVLTAESLKPFFLQLVQTPFMAFTRFNNSVVMGSLVSGIILYVPVYFICRLIVSLWRKHITGKVLNSKSEKKSRKTNSGKGE